MNKKYITLTICLLISLNAFSKECDDETKARMIKAGISDETIEKECGSNQEKSKVLEKKEVEKVSDENHKTYQAQIILLSSLGSGVSLYYNFKNDIWFGIDLQNNSLSASTTSTSGKHKFDLDAKFSTTYYNARYYLVESMPSFFLQGGIISRSWTIEEVETRISDNDKVGTYKTEYPNNGLNIGLGWNWISDQGISGGIHFINIIGGSPLHTYKMGSGWTCSDTCKALWESTVKKFVPTTTIHINIGYNFNL